MSRGRSIYFTETEIDMILEYMSEAVGILGEAEGTYEMLEKDIENGLGSALRKLYKGRNGGHIYAKYKTKR